MPTKVEVSHRTVIFTVFFLIFIAFLYQIRSILLGVFVAIVLMAALNPTVNWLNKKGVPRLLAILLLFLLTIALIVFALLGIIPALVEQTSVLIDQLPFYSQNLGLVGLDARFIDNQLSQLGSIPSGVLRLGLSVFNNTLNLVAILILTFYLLMERKNLDRYLKVLFNDKENKKAANFVDKLEHNLGGWIRAQLILMTLIGVLVYLGLTVLGIEFALPLAILAGILEVIPNFGPTFAAVPAILMGFAISPLTGVAVGALYFLIQQLENSLIVPQVMERTVGFNPVITIIALMIGFKLGGVLGAVLAIPFGLMIKAVISEFFPLEKLK